METYLFIHVFVLSLISFVNTIENPSKHCFKPQKSSKIFDRLRPTEPKPSRIVGPNVPEEAPAVAQQLGPDFGSRQALTIQGAQTSKQTFFGGLFFFFVIFLN